MNQPQKPPLTQVDFLKFMAWSLKDITKEMQNINANLSQIKDALEEIKNYGVNQNGAI